MRRLWLRLFLVCSCLATFTENAWSQQALPPQGKYFLGEGQVELFRGVFQYSHDDISIGPVGMPGQLTLTRYHAIHYAGGGPFGNSSGHSFQAAVYRHRYIEDPNGPNQWSYTYYVVIGRDIETFDEGYGNGYIAYDGTSTGTQILSRSGSGGPFTYTGPNGLVVNFGTIVTTCTNIGLDAGADCAPATTLVRPDGTMLSFAYDLAGSLTRLRLVSNNFGYAIGFEYNGTYAGNMTKACGVNLATTYVTTSAPCPSGAIAAQYGWSTPPPVLVSYTDPDGRVTSYTYSATTSNIATIKGAASSVADLTVAYDPASLKVTSESNGSGQIWTYAYQNNANKWSDIPTNDWTDVTTPLGHRTRRNWYGSSLPDPTSVVDPLNRTTTYSYTYVGLDHVPATVTLPEGNGTQYTYNIRGDVTEIRKAAKVGSGLADIVTSPHFPSTCSYVKTCDKPDYVIDARGGQTDYTYDIGHGGVLTETAPAVGGVRPQKRYVYAQRYAWIKNSTGGYVQAPTPVWLLSQERSCKTTAASGSSCAGGASDEVVISYDYGPDSGPNNLNLRGQVVDLGGLSLRTCYGYDAAGNRISQTSANAGLASCP